jgi:hypothetical protein
MKNELIGSEITDLEIQNKKRNLGTVTSFLMGGILGYAVWTQTSNKNKQVFKYIIGGSAILGVGYWLYTLKGVTKRKNAIEQKKSLIERGQTKPAPVLNQSDAQATTVVELANNPAKPNSQSSGMFYKN